MLTKACCKRTPKTSKAAPVNTSRRVRLSLRLSMRCRLNQAKLFAIRQQEPAAFFWPRTITSRITTRSIASKRNELKSGTLFGVELVDSVARLCCMNLLLHGIASEDSDEVPVQVKDALAGKHGEYEMVLTNPPFGKKSSVTIVNEAGEEDRQSLVVHRDDFWASTSNKQLNFLQHV